MTHLTVQLYEAWEMAVSEGKVVNLFQVKQDDPLGRWIQGDVIKYGVRLTNGKFGFYAENISQSRQLEGTTEVKRVGHSGYLCQFNSFRALRPGGSGRPVGRQPDIPAEPEHCRFHCQDETHPFSLLHREPLLQIQAKHFLWNVYYNIAPIEKKGHFLWVPINCGVPSARLPHTPQSLSCEFLEDTITIFKQLDQTILFFNALHAGASVNHFHLQGIFHHQTLPIEIAPMIDYHGYHLLANYPVQALVFPVETPMDELFICIHRLQQAGIPFNLVLLKTEILLVVRNIDHEIVSEFPGDGFAALGICGVLTTVDRNAYENITVEMIESTFQKMVIPGRQIIDTWL